MVSSSMSADTRFTPTRATQAVPGACKACTTHTIHTARVRSDRVPPGSVLTSPRKQVLMHPRIPIRIPKRATSLARATHVVRGASTRTRPSLTVSTASSQTTHCPRGRSTTLGSPRALAHSRVGSDPGIGAGPVGPSPEASSPRSGARRAGGLSAGGEMRGGVSEVVVALAAPPFPATPVPEPNARPAESKPARAPQPRTRGAPVRPDVRPRPLAAPRDTRPPGAGPGGARGDPGGDRRTSGERGGGSTSPSSSSGSSSVAPWLRAASKCERRISREQPREEKAKKSLQPAALRVTPPSAPPLPVASEPLPAAASDLAPQPAAPSQPLTPSARREAALRSAGPCRGPGARPAPCAAGLPPLRRKMCCEKWSHVAEMFLFIEDLEEDSKILCLCSRAFVE